MFWEVGSRTLNVAVLAWTSAQWSESSLNSMAFRKTKTTIFWQEFWTAEEECVKSRGGGRRFLTKKCTLIFRHNLNLFIAAYKFRFSFVFWRLAAILLKLVLSVKPELLLLLLNLDDGWKYFVDDSSNSLHFSILYKPKRSSLRGAKNMKIKSKVDKA